jgi:hypothetical protein
MTDDELRVIEERCNAATAGPWVGDRLDGTVKYRLGGETRPDLGWQDDDPTLVLAVDHKNGTFGFVGFNCRNDEMFVMHARTDVPALVAEVRRLREEQTTRVATQRELDIVLEDNQRLREEVTENDELRPMVKSAMAELIGQLQVENDRLREEIREMADGALELGDRWQAIRALANARLADTAHMASIQEAETLWKIIAATEGE